MYAATTATMAIMITMTITAPMIIPIMAVWLIAPVKPPVPLSSVSHDRHIKSELFINDTY